MNPESLIKAEAIFQAALEISPPQRGDFLNRECAGDAELRGLVERLLANDAAGMAGFLEAPDGDPEEHFTPPSVEGTWIDRYRLVRRIGMGGMGQVFLAKQQEPQRDVALKILRTDLSNPALARRFRLEIDVLGRLNHPGIAQIHDAGTTSDGNPYFAMEYVPGQPLSDFVRHHELGPRERLQLAIQICEAVHYANEQGVLHRDLKPANILVVDKGGGAYQVKVLDFGVARLNEEISPDVSVYTLPGQLLGTLAYMSPEQAGGESQDLDPRADVYQLGVILFELLSGKLPLDVDSTPISFALRRIAEEEPPGLGTMDETLRGDLEIIVAKAMAKEPQRRYAMPGDLAADIRRYLDGEPILARPTTAFYRIRKRLRKKRGTAMMLLTVAMVAVSVGWILFRGDSDITTKSAAMTMFTPEAAVKQGYYAPAISPDGTLVAAVELPGHLKIMSISGKDERLLIPGTEFESITRAVQWHPSGQKLLLTRNVIDLGHQLIWYDLATGEQETLLTSDDYLMPVLSADGKRAIIRRDLFREMAILYLETGAMETVARTDSNRQFHTPVWGPDEKRIAYVEATQKSIYRMKCMDLQGNTTTLMTEWLLETYPTQSSLYWLPDGRLLFAKDRDLSGIDVDIWALPMNSHSCEAIAEPHRLFSFHNWHVRDLSYSKVTNRLTFYARKTLRQVALFDINPDGGLTRRELPVSGWPGRPKSFVNDGKHLVIRETRGNDDSDAMLQDYTTGEIKPLLAGPDQAHPIAMSADGKHLFHFRGDKNMMHASLWAFCLADSQDIDLRYTLAVEDYYKWISSPVRGNGSSYLFSQWGGDLIAREVSVAKGVGPEMFRLPMPSGESFDSTIMSVDMSPDAKQIAYLVNGKDISLYDLASRETTVLPVDMGLLQKLQWSVDGQWIYIKGLMNPQAAYWFGRVNVSSGASEFLWGSEMEWPNEFFMSPDGRNLSCQMVEMSSALGVLEGL
jgi:Tol biopolymer transport system component